MKRKFLEYFGQSRIFELMLRTIWFVIFVLLCCGLVSVLVFAVPHLFAANMPIEFWRFFWFLFAVFRFVSWFALAPAIVWAAILLVLSLNRRHISAVQHIGIAIAVAVVGIALWFVIYSIFSWLIRVYIDPRFDDLGYLGAFTLFGAFALVVVFPLIAVILNRFAYRLGLGKLFTPNRIQEE